METLPPSENASPRKGDIKQANISLMSSLSNYLNESQKEKLQKYYTEWQSFTVACRAFAKMLLHALLRNSYLASLVGLYICGLTRVNLLNAGYRMSLILI